VFSCFKLQLSNQDIQLQNTKKPLFILYRCIQVANKLLDILLCFASVYMSPTYTCISHACYDLYSY